MYIEQMVADLFEDFDENGDGIISRREFVALVESLLHQKEIGFSSDIFRKFDANHDNVISREELIDRSMDSELDLACGQEQEQGSFHRNVCIGAAGCTRRLCFSSP